MYHNILGRAFILMHKTKGTNFHGLAKEMQESVLATDFMHSSVLPSLSNELFRKQLRVKAFKSYQWLTDPTAVYDLLIEATTLAPIERIMYTFLRWQGENAMLDPNTSPIGKMSGEDSPPRVASAELIRLMLDNRLPLRSKCPITLDQVAAGHLWLVTSDSQSVGTMIL